MLQILRKSTQDMGPITLKGSCNDFDLIEMLSIQKQVKNLKEDLKQMREYIRLKRNQSEDFVMRLIQTWKQYIMSSKSILASRQRKVNSSGQMVTEDELEVELYLKTQQLDLKTQQLNLKTQEIKKKDQKLQQKTQKLVQMGNQIEKLSQELYNTKQQLTKANQKSELGFNKEVLIENEILRQYIFELEQKAAKIQFYIKQQTSQKQQQFQQQCDHLQGQSPQTIRNLKSRVKKLQQQKQQLENKQKQVMQKQNNIINQMQKIAKQQYNLQNERTLLFEEKQKLKLEKINLQAQLTEFNAFKQQQKNNQLKVQQIPPQNQENNEQLHQKNKDLYKTATKNLFDFKDISSFKGISSSNNFDDGNENINHSLNDVLYNNKLKPNQSYSSNQIDQFINRQINSYRLKKIKGNIHLKSQPIVCSFNSINAPNGGFTEPKSIMRSKEQIRPFKLSRRTYGGGQEAESSLQEVHMWSYSNHKVFKLQQNQIQPSFIQSKERLKDTERMKKHFERKRNKNERLRDTGRMHCESSAIMRNAEFKKIGSRLQNLRIQIKKQIEQL